MLERHVLPQPVVPDGFGVTFEGSASHSHSYWPWYPGSEVYPITRSATADAGADMGGLGGSGNSHDCGRKGSSQDNGK